MKLTLKRINKELEKQGYLLELIKGDGYFYFITLPDLNVPFDSYSVCVYRLNQLKLNDWIYEANIFYKELENKYNIELLDNYNF